ncbi:MAG: phosphoribosylglycinamide formyltransferase [Synergistaceae bacterium]|nr:phosphoribosylglycinamide formyltransferase [Synergistaceae bacterium]
MTRIAILISGRGSNMEALVHAANNGKLSAEVCFVGCDNENARGLQIARDMGLKTCIFPYGPDSSGKAEEALKREINENKVEWLVLAGFMRVLSKDFVKNMEGRIVNIHPSLLPSFKGAHAIADAFRWGVKVTGVTIHIADEFVDNGKIIAQRAIEIKEDDTIETLTERIHKIEHSLYPETLSKLFTL